MNARDNNWDSYYSHLRELAPQRWQRRAAGARNELALFLFARFYETRNFITSIDSARSIVDYWLEEMGD